MSIPALNGSSGKNTLTALSLSSLLLNRYQAVTKLLEAVVGGIVILLGVDSGIVERLLQLPANLRHVLQLLDGTAVALKSRLDNLARLTLSLGKLFQLLGVLLLLLKQLLVYGTCLLRLLDKLLNRLLTVLQLLIVIVIHRVVPPVT